MIKLVGLALVGSLSFFGALLYLGKAIYHLIREDPWIVTNIYFSLGVGCSAIYFITYHLFQHSRKDP